MSTSKFDAVVEYEDGTKVEVKVGQRELAAFEAQPMSQFGGGRGLLRMRFAAFEALRRTHRLPLGSKGQPVTFDEWDELVDQVTDPEPAEPADPTPPDQPAES